MLRIDGESAFVFVLVQETYTVCALFPDHTCNQLQFVTQGWERFLKPPPPEQAGCSGVLVVNVFYAGKLRQTLSNATPDAISHTVGFVSRKRPFSTEAQIGLSYNRKSKRAFSTQFFRLSFPTGGSSRKLDFIDSICQSKNSLEKKLHLFFQPIA